MKNIKRYGMGGALQSFSNPMLAQGMQGGLSGFGTSGMTTFADGGKVDTSVEIGNFRRNIMGTLSFDLKLKKMRKPQDFSVYPAQEKTDYITIQSSTRFGKIEMSSGRGLMSQSHANGAYGYHFQSDKKEQFQLTNDQLYTLLKELEKTAGKKVGSSVVFSDNSYADQFANGGEVSKPYTFDGESYSYYNTFGVDQKDFIKLVDVYHTTNPLHQMDRIVERLTYREFESKYGGDVLDAVMNYIHQTHESHEKYAKYAKGGKVDNKKYNFTILEYANEEALLDDELTDGDDFYGTKERVIELQKQRMQRGYCIYFTISNGEGWYYESEDLDELKESLENSDDDFEDEDEYAKGGEVNDQVRVVSKAIFSPNSKGRNMNLTDRKITEGKLSSLIATQNSEYIASDIFESNQVNGKVKTTLGDKTYGQLLALISHAKADRLDVVKFAKGGEIESRFEVDDVVYNKKHKTIGIVRMKDDRYGEVKTDADGNVSVDDLEYYNPLKYTHQTEATIAPSTKKEIEERMLWKPFSSKEYAKGGEVKLDNRFEFIKEIGEYKIYYNKSAKNYAIVWKSRFAPAFETMEDVENYISEKKMEFAKGGEVADMYVAVGEKDGYWTIISKPSSKENAQKLLEMTTLPRGEMGKVVSVEDAKNHKLVIGREYLKYAKGGSVYSSDEMYVLKVYDLNGNLLDDSKRFLEKNMSKAKEYAIDMFEDAMRKKYGDDLRFTIEEAQAIEAYAKGGEVAQGNYEMMLSQTKEVQHHAKELQNVLKGEKEIEAWVVAKMENVSSTLSDITHYLDGKTEYAQGGEVEGFKVGDEVVFEFGYADTSTLKVRAKIVGFEGRYAIVKYAAYNPSGDKPIMIESKLEINRLTKI